MSDRPNFGAELGAMLREGIKDVRETVMETFVGSPEQTMEPGVPLSPTMQEVTQDRAVVSGYSPQNDALDLGTSSLIQEAEKIEMPPPEQGQWQEIQMGM